MINLFIGHDFRETVGTHVFIESVLATATVPVSITPLHKPMLKRAFGGDVAEGTNAFTISRFLIPFLMDWRGTAIFMDGADMLMRGDIADLEALRDPYKAVQVVKHDYKTNSAVKYKGTQMEAPNEDYPRKNWASLMLINCAHYVWRKMTPSVLLKGNKLETLNFSWCPDQYIGSLPIEWNFLCQEFKPISNPKLVHYSLGIPLFEYYRNDPYADEYRKILERTNSKAD